MEATLWAAEMPVAWCKASLIDVSHETISLLHWNSEDSKACVYLHAKARRDQLGLVKIDQKTKIEEEREPKTPTTKEFGTSATDRPACMLSSM